MEAVISRFTSLYPPDGWIPASAGMTEGRAEERSPFAGVRGVPEVFFFIPFIPQSWGIKGLNDGC